MANMVKSKMRPLYDLSDLMIEPSSQSDINSRSECNPFTEFNSKKVLPLMNAPMDTVVDATNYHYFRDNNIVTILPRINGDYPKEVVADNIIALSLEQFENNYLKDLTLGEQYITDGYNKVLIDVANGHMKKIMTLTERAKNLYGDGLWIMVGNIANPSTFGDYAYGNIDAVRCGIGGGAACTTSANVAIHYPMASLLNRVYDIKNHLNSKTLIIADGGFKTYSDVIKALALGADYVMLGSMFNKALESCSPILKKDVNSLNYIVPPLTPITYEVGLESLAAGIPLFKEYRGMSTKAVQKDLGKEVLKTSEGIVKYNQVEYTLASWTENFTDYLRSAMSYTNSPDLQVFKDEAKLNLISEKSFERFNK